jgi:NAD(P)-dependent dehydrogenase (short-subunit alcohol dehydrogenase family)
VSRRPRRELRLEGSVAVVTGAARGIGRASAEELLRRGARVGLLDADTDELHRVARGLDPRRALPLPCDVRDLAAVTTAVAATVSHFGRLDVVVANAGISPPTATLRVVEPAALRRVLDVNVLGVWHVTRASLEHVIRARGHVSVISSCAAFAPGMGGAAYMMSKAAAEQFGRALRIELAPHGATAGVVSFGIVDTSMTSRTLDDDELGRRIGALLPWPLDRRLSTAQAAGVVVRGIERRRAAQVAPWGWRPYGWLRGTVNPALDRRLARSRNVQDLLRQVEQRVLSPR